jgi:hypothetical protein
MIVVIRQDGCIEWTKKFKNIIIFNKGDVLPDEYNCINIPNIGLTYHTIFTYIYNNYENLDDYIIFITVYAHTKICSNMLNKIEYYLNNPLNIHFELITHVKERIYTRCIENDKEPQCIDDESIDYHSKHDFLENVYIRVCSELFGMVEHKCIYKGRGASFIVSKKMILKRRKPFYLKIIKLLEHSAHPDEHYIIDIIIQKIFADRYTNFKITYEYNVDDSTRVVDTNHE